MFRTARATSLAALSTAAILLLSACGGTDGSSGAAARASEDAGGRLPRAPPQPALRACPS